MDSGTFSSLEHEVISLYAVWDMIDEMVNYEMFVALPSRVDTNVMFSTSTHTRLFNVLLADFLAVPRADRNRKTLPFGLPRPPRGGAPSDDTFLFYLEHICVAPSFPGDAMPLHKIVTEFRQWLDAECVVPNVWLSEISIEADIRATRLSLLKICGNIGKHNFSKLEVCVRDIRDILGRSGAAVDEQQAFRALPSFYEWFHRNFFVYHSSTIAEFLNNLRWAIYRYLKPEFERSYIPPQGPDPRYSYTYPVDCRQPLAKSMYWELMNKTRREPYFPAFSVSRSFKTQY